MITKVTLDKRGRVIIPKRLRNEMSLVSGDAFQIVESTEEKIVLRFVRRFGPEVEKEEKLRTP